MSELPQNQDSPEDAQFEAEAMALFMHEGFSQLETPATVTQIKRNVKQELTSGIDFDPLPRQMGRRLVWTAVPAIAAFVLASGVLALRPVPRIPLEAWRISRGVDTERPDVTAVNLLYKIPAPLPKLTDLDTGYPTRIKGNAAPEWYRKETHKPIPGAMVGPTNMSNLSNMVGQGFIRGLSIIDDTSFIDGPINGAGVKVGSSDKSGVSKK